MHKKHIFFCTLISLFSLAYAADPATRAQQRAAHAAARAQAKAQAKAAKKARKEAERASWTANVVPRDVQGQLASVQQEIYRQCRGDNK